MKAVTTVTRFDGQLYYIATRCCLSKQEADAACALLDGMPSPEAYLPSAAEIALADGQPATGGGESSQTLLDAGEFVELAPEAAALAELQTDELPFNGPDSPGEAAPEVLP